jgi:O-antigen ligase
MRITVGTKTWESAKIEWTDWLLIIGLTLAPMTGLRIWKVGPGEVLCLLWGIRYLFKAKNLKSNLSIFFALFIIAMAAGSIIGFIVAPKELRTVDLLTWVYLGVIAISLYEGLKTKLLHYLEMLFFTFAEFATVWNLFLFLYSRFIGSTFLGAPLWYNNVRFSGGGTNPHQIAVLLCGLVFIFLRSLLKKEKMIRSIVLLIVCVYLMLETASSTGVLSIALGIAVSAYFLVADLFPKNKVGAIVILSLILLLISLVFWSFFYGQFMEWVMEDKNGLGRIEIFSSFGTAFIKSPLFGLGPGVHGVGGTIEFHNTYLEIIAASGVIGGIAFIVYSIGLFRDVLKADWKLFPILVAMYAYGLAGFAMRRLVYWGIVVFVTVIAEKRNVLQVPQG